LLLFFLQKLGLLLGVVSVKLAILLEGFLFLFFCFGYGGMFPWGLRVWCSSSDEG
jgi:hypothetical protein